MKTRIFGVDKNENFFKGKPKDMSKKEIKDPIIIEADFVKETKESFLLDCEGDQEWFPKSQVNFDAEKKELECPRWLLNKKFPDEKY